MKNIVIRLVAVVMLIACALTALSSCAGTYDVYVVEMEVKDFGTIKIKLDHTSAPATVENFLSLIDSGYYVGKLFHRAQEGFVIQGGSANGDGISDGNMPTVKGEFSENGYTGNHILHREGVISMARTSDPNSASTQFFITIGDARASLDGSYAGFGYVDKDSMDVVHEIAEYMFQYTSGDMGVIPTSLKAKMPVISSVKVVDKYNIE